MTHSSGARKWIINIILLTVSNIIERDIVCVLIASARAPQRKRKETAPQTQRKLTAPQLQLQPYSYSSETTPQQKAKKSDKGQANQHPHPRK
jgi:dethiobiotin synthetase